MKRGFYLIVLTMLIPFVGLAQNVSSLERNGMRVVSQTNNDPLKVETNYFWDNWFIGVGGGAQMFFGDHNKQMDFMDRLTPALDVYIGKWFTPGIGVRAMYSGMNIKGVTQSGAHSNGKVYDASKWLSEQEFGYYHLHGDVMFNLNALFGGYKATRVWHCSPYAGFGIVICNEKPKSKELPLNVGILNSFRVSDAIDVNLDVRGTLVNDRFDGELGGREQEGILAATIGIAYKFKNRGWNRSTTTIMYDERELNSMREALDARDRDIEALRDELSRANRVTEYQNVDRTVVAPSYVTFKIGRSELSKSARVTLGMLAESIKNADGNVVYIVTGYADEVTGTVAINERLSRERANAVFNCLVKEFGVPADRLEVQHCGGVANMFYDDPSLSRAVITKAK